MALSEDLGASRGRPRLQGWARYAFELAAIGAIYFALAEVGLRLASINPHATPIWPSTGFALAAVLLRGYRIWPAFLIAAFRRQSRPPPGSARHLARDRRGQYAGGAVRAPT